MASTQPPPAKPVSSRVRKGFQALAANQEKMEAIRKNAEASKYFDGSAPMTRTKRQQARAYFEMYVESCYGTTDVGEVWDAREFVTRTKEFLEGVVNVSKGKFEEKVKTQTLWGYKHALYWWAAVLVTDFHLMWQKWHVEVSRHIHQLSAQESLSIRSWKKSNLSDSELVMIFRYICEQRYGMQNLKQHWAALLLVWLTAARPGSIVVTEGYQKGAPLGLPGKVREASETLRWSDVEFVNMKGGVAVRVNFRHDKGYRNPNKDGSHYSDARRTFLFLPSMGERLEFDLPIILFGIAYQRGLFVQTLEQILDQRSSEVFLEKREDIDQQAVFVAADQAGRLNPTKPMHIHALNPKLQQLCTGVGLMERNTYYSLRRTAIIEVRRKHGTEQAKDIAFHVASANSLFFYDNVGFGDVDMQQFRLGGPESMSREEVQKYFSQANLARWQPAEDDELTFKEAMEQAVKEQLPIQDGYITQELELKQLYDEVSNKLGELQMTGDISDTEKIPTGHSAKDGATYKALSYQYELHDLTKKIEEQLATRKKVFRSIRLQLRKSITQDLRKKHRAVLAESQKQARRKLSTGGSYEPQPVRDVQVTGLRQFTVEAALLDEDPEADFSSEDDVEGVDEEVLEQQNITSREEPECWGDLQDEVHVQIGGGNSTVQTLQTRRDFLMTWIQMSDTVVAQSNLLCPRCQIDPTMDKSAKERRFTLFRLNTHMRGNTHSREAQLRRALKQDQHTNTSIVMCPTCRLPCKGIRTFVKHLKTFHPEQLWEDLEDESASENATDVTDFEGFSDSREDAGANEVGETEFEEFPQLPSTYTGKGKGRAE